MCLVLLAGMAAMLEIFKRGNDAESASGDSNMLIWTLIAENRLPVGIVKKRLGSAITNIY